MQGMPIISSSFRDARFKGFVHDNCPEKTLMASHVTPEHETYAVFFYYLLKDRPRHQATCLSLVGCSGQLILVSSVATCLGTPVEHR